MTSAELLVCERAVEDDLAELLALALESGRTPPSLVQQRAAICDAARAVLLLRAYRTGPGGCQRELLAACSVQAVVDELEIHDLVVRGSRRRQGLARRLLAATLGWAFRRGARTAYLEVRSSNAPARALYARAGFVSLGRRSSYYEEPREDALLLELPLAAPGLDESGTLNCGPPAC